MEPIKYGEFTLLQYAGAYTVLLNNVPLDWGLSLDEAVSLVLDLSGDNLQERGIDEFQKLKTIAS